jgi:O-succinylbenzoic acid--CoA ligase
MPDVVALDLPPGRGFVDALRAVWDSGDAVAPLDPRLPPAAARELMAVLAPTRVVRSDGSITKLVGGVPAEDGDALVMATSGTSGRPRGVVLTHAAVRASAEATSARLGVDPARHRWLCCLPLAHIGGMSVITRAVVTGTALDVIPQFDATDVERRGRDGGVTHVSLVATALGRVDPTMFETILLGGAAPPSSIPPNVVVTYGMTETGSGVVYDGRPLDGVELAIGTGRRGEGEPGEVLLRCPMLMRTYRDGADPRIAGPDGASGWLPTGDGGHIDADGRLHVEGRQADVIVTGAEKVWPQRVEQVLALDPSVAEVGVWKRPDPEWGERVVAWVVPSDPDRPPTLTELRERVAEVLPRWAAPRELVLTDRLPRTAIGKLRRRALA